jgi:hypothetical protein
LCRKWAKSWAPSLTMSRGVYICSRIKCYGNRSRGSHQLTLTCEAPPVLCEWWEDLEEVQDAHGCNGLQ